MISHGLYEFNSVMLCLNLLSLPRQVIRLRPGIHFCLSKALIVCLIDIYFVSIPPWF